MRRRPNRYNPKRRIAPTARSELREELAGRVTYVGSPAHKRNPGDFGLTPPSAPRPDKQLCDRAAVLDKASAQKHLRDGVLRGLVSEQRVGDFPQNVWAVLPNGMVLEAQLDNREQGTYHGYPLAEHDPFAEAVRVAWEPTDA